MERSSINNINSSLQVKTNIKTSTNLSHSRMVFGVFQRQAHGQQGLE
jgi:hypothetical protein